MRVLFAAVAGRPHLFPIVPLAWACRAAGHEVRIASAPSATDTILHTGLPAVVVGSGPRLTPQELRDLVATVYGQGAWPPDWAANPHLLDDRQHELVLRLGRYLVTASDAMADDLLAFARQWQPDLIVHDAITYAGAVVAQVLRIPDVRHLFGTASLPRFELDGGHPLPEYTRLFHRFHTDVRVHATATVDPTPPSLRFPNQPHPSHDMRYIPYNGPGTVPRWLAPERDRPRICLTWGHTSPDSIGGEAAAPYRVALDAIAATDVDVVVVTSAEQIDKLGELPPNAVAAPSVPLQFVVAHCDAIVQQGGDGTTLTSAVAGIPQLAITCKPDAEIAAGRLAAVGAGVHLRYQELRDSADREDVIRAALETLLLGPAGEAAELLRAEIVRQPPPSEVAAALAGLDEDTSTPRAWIGG
jgi:glycosyltransferase